MQVRGSFSFMASNTKVGNSQRAQRAQWQQLAAEFFASCGVACSDNWQHPQKQWGCPPLEIAAAAEELVQWGQMLSNFFLFRFFTAVALVLDGLCVWRPCLSSSAVAPPRQLSLVLLFSKDLGSSETVLMGKSCSGDLASATLGDALVCSGSHHPLGRDGWFTVRKEQQWMEEILPSSLVVCHFPLLLRSAARGVH